MKSIGLFGEWNTTNLGDQAIALHAAEYFLKKGFKVKLFSLGSFRYLGTIYITTYKDTLTKLCESARLQSNIQQGKTKRSISLLVKKNILIEQAIRFFRNLVRLKIIKEHLISCECIVVGGGDLLNQDHINFRSPIYFITKFSQRTHIPLISLGCSSSSFYTGISKAIMRAFIKHTTFIAVRDCKTQAVLKSLANKDVMLLGDFALNLPIVARNPNSNTNQHVAINIMSTSTTVWAKYSSLLVSLISELKSQGLSITLFTTGNLEDLVAVQQIKRMVKLDIEHFHPSSLDSLQYFFSTIDIVVATRLHAAILALNNSVPAVSICFSDKVKFFFETIDLANFCYPLEKTDTAAPIVEMIKQKKYERIIHQVNVSNLVSTRQNVFQQLSMVLTRFGAHNLIDTESKVHA